MGLNTYPSNPWPMSTDQKGSGGGSYVLPTASADTLGGVKVGSNLNIADGVLSAPAPYELPIASAETLGGVKVGNGLSIDDGVLSTNETGFTETTLYSGTDTAATYTLTDDFDHYDCVNIIFARSNNIYVSNIYTKSFLLELLTNGYTTGAFTDDKYSLFTVTSKKLFTKSSESDLHIVKIVGIKY